MKVTTYIFITIVEYLHSVESVENIRKRYQAGECISHGVP